MRRSGTVALVLGLLFAVTGGSPAAATGSRPLPTRSSIPAARAEPPPGFHTAAFADSVVDRPRDAHRRADILGTTVRYRTRTVVFRAELRNPGSHRTDNWRRGDTMLLWFIDTDNDGDEEYAASVWANRRGRLVGTTFNAVGAEVLCRRRASRRGDVFRLVVPHRCISSPPRMRFQLAMFYDRNVANLSDRSISVDAAPNRSWSSWLRKPPQPIRVVWAPRPSGSVPYGTSVWLKAKFDGVYYADYPLSLYRRYVGSSTWERIRVASPMWSDTVNFGEMSLHRPADYQVRFAGNRHWLPDRSPVVRIGVTMHVTDDLSAHQRPVGHAWSVSGHVRPLNPGGMVYLQRVDAGKWVNVGSARVTSENMYEIKTTPRSSGMFTYRVLAAGTGHVSSGAGETEKVPIFNARINSVHASDPAAEVQDLNSEYISVVNNGRVPINVGGWLVEANLVTRATVPYAYAVTELQPGHGARIHTGAGQPRPGHLYLNRSAPLWPDAGVARLYDGSQRLMDELQYGPGS